MSILLPSCFPKYLIDDVVNGGCECIVTSRWRVVRPRAHRGVLCSDRLFSFCAWRVVRARPRGIELFLFGCSVSLYLT